jgi:hypothetical protein
MLVAGSGASERGVRHPLILASAATCHLPPATCATGDRNRSAAVTGFHRVGPKRRGIR